MFAFYSRSEADGRVVVEFNPWPRFVSLALFAVAITGPAFFEPLASETEMWIGPMAAFFALQALRFLKTRRVMSELRAAMRDGAIEASGSQWSLNNPARYSYAVSPAEGAP